MAEVRFWVVTGLLMVGVVGGLAAGLAATANAQVELDLSVCALPAEPEVPDGAVATTTQMRDANVAVREYINSGQSQLECLDQLQTAHADSLTEEQRATITAAYNAGVDQLNAVAGAYNNAVRTYKARNPAEE